ncbi:Ammonium transporter NrgA [Gimesia panareensis]|uniref:Ammonium transporter n=1 Tax=Gimesia panareensis TaxID=2527978 RepID=A0A518FVL1_9PLAN|nr:ammonium transporter [Gimesia panareensis]QDV20387.1 Ammonium transporter NrgA [Gimesia panareensis]
MNWKHALMGLTASLVVVLAVSQPAWAYDEAEAKEEKPAAAETAAPAETTEEAPAEEEAPPLTLSEIYYALDNSMLFLCAVLVLFMQSGFAMVESGFNSSKNTINILFKNLMDVCVGVLIYYSVGYGLMYPDVENPMMKPNGYFGFGQFGIPAAGEPGPAVLHKQVDFLFQVAFAATAATIVSGAVAGRLKFSSYLIYSIVLTGIIYPVSGYWKWGGGWLNEMGFYDFAGSIVVHAVGGFAGLAGALVLGPRIGRFKDGKSVPIPGHNIAQATLGVFILWVGWYGFNPGSQLAFAGSANTDAVMLIATNTTLAAAAGGVAAMILGWIMYTKPDISMALNGVLAGLVGITANCDGVSNIEAIVIGLIAGLLVVFGILALEKLKIDDPVGAFPVHGLCGIWGGVATGIFAEHDFWTQVTGSVVIPVYAFVTMFILFSFLKVIGQLRVSEEDELKGLDLSEHGMQAYH